MKKKQKKNRDEETYLGDLVENSWGVGAVGNFGLPQRIGWPRSPWSRGRNICCSRAAAPVFFRQHDFFTSTNEERIDQHLDHLADSKMR